MTMKPQLDAASGATSTFEPQDGTPYNQASHEGANPGRAVASRTRPDPDPIDELATIDDSGAGGAPDRPRLAVQPGRKPGFGPNESAGARVEGNPDLGIDPRDTNGRSS